LLAMLLVPVLIVVMVVMMAIAIGIIGSRSVADTSRSGCG
jgi:hypothetical protein